MSKSDPGESRTDIPARSTANHLQEIGLMEMDNATFGLTMLICGMGGTILTLWIMSLVMAALSRLFPEKADEKKES